METATDFPLKKFISVKTLSLAYDDILKAQLMKSTISKTVGKSKATLKLAFS